MSIEYGIIVKNKTRLEALIERFNTKAHARFYIESLGGNFEDYEAEHEVFMTSLHKLQTDLSSVLKYKIVERIYLPSYMFSENNLIIVIGQDGLVANTAKYANGRPIIAVNPDKSRYDGVLLPFDTENFIYGVEQVLKNQFPSRSVRFAEALLGDGQRLIAFNDLFIGSSTHVSARYRIEYRDSAEEHSSSGLIVSTAVGATGWLSSIFNMAYGITALSEKISRKGKTSAVGRQSVEAPSLQDDELMFAVREPFKSIRTQTGITAGLLRGTDRLLIESFMPNGGVIFSDGIESDFLNFNSGTMVSVGLAPEIATLVGA